MGYELHVFYDGAWELVAAVREFRDAKLIQAYYETGAGAGKFPSNALFDIELIHEMGYELHVFYDGAWELVAAVREFRDAKLIQAYYETGAGAGKFPSNALFDIELIPHPL